MSFWQAGFWAAGFWSAGFWGDEATEQTAAGGRARRRPRTIDKPVNFHPELVRRRREEEVALMLSGAL